MADRLVQIRGLRTTFYTEAGKLDAVDGVDFYIDKGETLGVVGESGCGKSVTALSILRLISYPPGRISGGQVWFEGVDLLGESERYMKTIRGRKISMIFQEPMTSLNPLFTIGDQVLEVFRLHRKMEPRQATARAVGMLKLVGIPRPEKVFDEYPHQLSGGMRQRVMIAAALACDPSLLIADEPTTALDVSIQAQILELMKELKQKIQTSIMLITHDLGVIAEVVDRVIVMYAGQIVEHSQVSPLFADPLHPYTEGLLNSIPRIDGGSGKLEPIKGVVPDLINPPPGCRFAPRCRYARQICSERAPALLPVGDREVRCLRYDAAAWGRGERNA